MENFKQIGQNNKFIFVVSSKSVNAEFLMSTFVTLIKTCAVVSLIKKKSLTFYKIKEWMLKKNKTYCKHICDMI